jgi:hypothetical protein
VLKNRAVPAPLWSAGQAAARRGAVDEAGLRALVAEAARHGDVSEEHVRFIAALADPRSARRVAEGPAVPPDRLDLHVDTAVLDRVRRQAASRLDMTAVERTIQRDPGLVALLNVLNDREITPGALRHRVQREKWRTFWQLGPLGVWRVWKSGLIDRQSGEAGPLANRLAADPALRATLNSLLWYVLAPGADLRVASLWARTRELAREKGAADPTGTALAALAILVSEQHMKGPLAAHPALKGTYEALLAGMDRLRDAPESQVFGHGVRAANPNGDKLEASAEDFTSDHVRHFFPHAYLAYELRQQGFSPDQARAASGFIGVAYEILGGGMAENGGNDALHDVLKNAYGAAWGSLLAGNPGTRLPRTFEGPAISDRDRPHAPQQGKFRRLWEIITPA